MKNEKQEKNESFEFKKGTVLMLGSDAITLTEDTRIPFVGAENEQLVVGMLLHSKNLEINREQLKAGYNGFGMLTHTAEELAEAKAKEEAPTEAEVEATEEEFRQTQRDHEAAAASKGEPVPPLDPNNVPSQQRAPVLGSPELKDVEKMNNMTNVPSDEGFPPLASKPRTETPETGRQSQVNESQDSIVANGQVTDRANINGAPNTAIEVAKQTAGIEGTSSDSTLTTSSEVTGGNAGSESSAAAKTADAKPAAKPAAKTKSPAKPKAAAKTKKAAEAKKDEKAAEAKKDDK